MSDRMLAISIALLLLPLLAVVLLAKKFSLVVDVVTARSARRRLSRACWWRC